ncbi:unnamed protein product [Amaranthus hypochondriacus]
MAGKDMRISLKLLVDTKANKVLFAEATKEFVDFIFHIMCLPLGTVVKLLSQNKMVGCLGDLYKSVSSLNTQYFQTDLNKHSVLNPKSSVNVPLLSLKETADNPPGKFYKCGSCSGLTITDSLGVYCVNSNRCQGTMSIEMKYVKQQANSGNTTQPITSSGDDGGYVKGVVTYMVMDNLEVKPMSTISGITLINKFHVKDVSALEEKEVHLGFEQGLAILKASLESKCVLTNVFLGNNTCL